MTLALVGLAVLAVVIFAFVLEPVLRARGDRAVLDAASLPEHDFGLPDDDAIGNESLEDLPRPSQALDERQGGRRTAIDRPAGSDAS